MTAFEVVDMLSGVGGYGIAGLMFFLYSEEKKERVRYRDVIEKFLGELPNNTRALEDLSAEVERLKGNG